MVVVMKDKTDDDNGNDCIHNGEKNKKHYSNNKNNNTNTSDNTNYNIIISIIMSIIVKGLEMSTSPTVII